jgi:hypothetical protein
MARSPYRAAIPLGVSGAITVVNADIDPVVVLRAQPEMLFDPLFEL